MLWRPGGRWRCAAIAAVALAGVSGCASTHPAPAGAPPTTTVAQAVSTAVAPVTTTPAARSVNWFDLDVGDCLADPPPTDPNVVAVAVVDCAAPHRAEVYVRAPLAVNTAVVGVATAKCDAGFTAYTGRPVASGAYATTFLIDSNQNRTSTNPDPSTVICLLEAADGGALTASARR